MLEECRTFEYLTIILFNGRSSWPQPKLTALRLWFTEVKKQNGFLHEFLPEVLQEILSLNQYFVK